MKKSVLKSTLVALSISVLLAGCQTTRTNAMTGEEETNSATKGLLGGCLAGAVAGGLINDGKGAAIGCVGGGAVGYAVGANFDKQEEALRQELVGTGVQIRRIGEDKIELVLAGDVTFASGSSSLSAGIKPSLRSVVKVMNEFDDTALVISGHTDSSGSAEFNKSLSETRAMSVKNYLNEQGLSYNRTHSQGFGEMTPKCDNKTATGKACNRRVELMIVPK